MAKIHNPQDENGIVLINNTIFQTEVDERKTAITSEAEARENADADLQTNIDNEAAARENAIAVEVETRAAADTTLQANIDAEAAARNDADATLQTSINEEVEARAAADTTLQTNIDNEVSARTEAINSVNTAIEAETTAREAAITAETEARTAADATLQTNIDNEVSARTAADTALQTNIDAATNYSFDVDTQKEGYTLGLVDSTGTVGNVIGVIFDKNHIKGKKVASVTLNILATNPTSDAVLTHSFLTCNVFNNSTIGTELGASSATEVVAAEAMDKNGTTATQYKKVTYTFNNIEIPDNTEKLLFKFSTTGAEWDTVFGDGLIKVGTVFNGNTQVKDDGCAILVHSNSSTYIKIDKCHWSQISFVGSINDKLEEHNNSIKNIEAGLINNIEFYSIEGDTETEIGAVTKTGNTARIKAWITQQIATEDQTRCMASGASVYKSVKAEADRAKGVEENLSASLAGKVESSKFWNFTRESNETVDITNGGSIELSLSNESAIILTATATSQYANCDIEIGEDGNSLTINATIIEESRPNTFTMSYIILDAICAEMKYDASSNIIYENPQHVCYVIPVIINDPGTNEEATEEE